MTPPPGRTTPLVLVADDDPDIRALVVHTLRREQADVLSAGDGEEALALARARRPDLLVLDVSMPRATGFEVCRALAGDGDAPPVIFLTAHGQQSSVVEGLDLGAVDYIVKPFRAAELAARVRAALRTRRTLAALAEESATDALTGLLNRRRLEERTAEAVEVARRSGGPLACLMLDVDRFKDVNDVLGHAAGDELLRAVSRAVRSVARAGDVAGRYGGDELALLLPGTDTAGAADAGLRIREAAAEAAGLLVAAHPELRPSVSVGVAEWRPGDDASSLVDAADRALLEAKRSGRDRVYAAVRRDGGEPAFRAVAA